LEEEWEGSWMHQDKTSSVYGGRLLIKQEGDTLQATMRIQLSNNTKIVIVEERLVGTIFSNKVAAWDE
jgi:hypothetical protein